MRNIMLFVFAVIFSISSISQEIYKNNKTKEKAIFTGVIDENNCLQIYENGNFRFEKKENLTQMEQLNLVSFLSEIGKSNLIFNFEGNEPFWNAQISSNTLFFNDNKKHTFKIDFVQDLQSDYAMMFSSKNAKVFGLIKRINIKKNKEKGCQLSLTDNYTVYEFYVSLESVMYKGCGSIIANF